MKVLALLARKGGAGKTTLAVHLAVVAVQAGRRVLLVDADPQRSAADWWRARDAPMPELVECEAERVRDVLGAARRAGVGLAVVDTPPSVAADTAALARLADLVLIPTRPAILDLRAIAATAELVRAARRPGAIVVNAAPPGRGDSEATLTAEARAALAVYGLPVCPVAVGNRAALAHALAAGQAVTEYDSAGRAAAELRCLYDHVETRLWPGDRL